MSKHFCYIIHSKLHNKFYVGETENFEERITLHNTGFFKGSYTSNINDWEEFIVIECSDRQVARKIETHIKSMRNRKYYFNLKQYPELVNSLILKHS